MTLGSQFANLTEFIDLYHLEAPDRKIDNAVIFTTSFPEIKHFPDFAGACRNIRQELAKDPIHYRLTLGNDNPTFVPIEEADITDKADADSFATKVYEEILKRSAERGGNEKFIFCLAGGRKTMSTTLHLAASLFARDGDEVWHLFIKNSESNDGKYHLSYLQRHGATIEGEKHGDSTDYPGVLVPVPFPKLSKLYFSLQKERIIKSFEDVTSVMGTITGALSDSLGDAFKLIRHIDDDALRNSLIELVSRWSTPQGQSLLWGGNIYDYFVDHGFQHARNVLGLAEQILRMKPVGAAELSDLELYLLTVAIWLHDIGMSGTDRESDFKAVRKKHGRLSADRIAGFVKEATPYPEFDILKRYAEPLKQIVSYHQQKEPLDENQKRQFDVERPPIQRVWPTEADTAGGAGKVSPESVRTRGLAALLQIADACDVQIRREGEDFKIKERRNDRHIETLLDRIRDKLLLDGSPAYHGLITMIDNAAPLSRYLLDLVHRERNGTLPASVSPLVSELELIAKQRRNHYALHKAAAETVVKDGMIVISPRPEAASAAHPEAEYIDLYYRLIRNNIMNDLKLTHRFLKEELGFAIKGVVVSTFEPVETEIKYSIAARAGIDALREWLKSCPVIAAFSTSGKPKSIRHIDRYFDDEARSLERAGKGLRLRVEEDRILFAQAKEAESEQRRYDRIETERFCTCDDLERLTRSPGGWIGVFPGFTDRPEEIRHAVTIETHRDIFTFENMSEDLFETSLEVCLDRCRVFRPGESGPELGVFYEVEVENTLATDRSFRQFVADFEKMFDSLGGRNVKNKYQQAVELLRRKEPSR